MADVIECAWCHTTPRVMPSARRVPMVACRAIQLRIPCNFAKGLNGYAIPLDLWNEIMRNTKHAVDTGVYGMKEGAGG